MDDPRVRRRQRRQTHDRPPPEMPGTNLVERDTAEMLVTAYNDAIDLYLQAHRAISRANRKLEKARARARTVGLGADNFYVSDEMKEVERFGRIVQMVPEAEYMKTARDLLLHAGWARVVEISGVEAILDRQAMAELRDQMRYRPPKPQRDGELIDEDEIARQLPEFTVENIESTVAGWRANAGHMLWRGIANVFSQLDRRFRSHSGVAFGRPEDHRRKGKRQKGAGVGKIPARYNRIILPYAVDHMGHLNYDDQAKIADVERVFLMLDGFPPTMRYAGICGQLEAALRDARQARWSSQPAEPRGYPYNPLHYRRTNDREAVKVEGRYFKAKTFRTVSSLHLEFTRPDLVAEVNRGLAAWFGEVIGDAMTGRAPGKDPLGTAITTPAKFFGFYPSPPAVVDAVLSGLPLYRKKDEPPPRILEPSAGTGNLARPLAQLREELERSWKRDVPDESWSYRPLVDCIELQPEYAEQLRAEGIYHRVLCADFLKVKPADLGTAYDIIVMNPPFDLERDIAHVTHALKFLAPDGLLVAVMSAGTEFRETRRSAAFRALMVRMKATIEDLPIGSFSEQGTNVSTIIVRVRANGREPECRYGRHHRFEADPA